MYQNDISTCSVNNQNYLRNQPKIHPIGPEAFFKRRFKNKRKNDTQKIGKVSILASKLVPGKGNHHCLFAYFSSPGLGAKVAPRPLPRAPGTPKPQFLMILAAFLIDFGMILNRFSVNFLAELVVGSG